VKNTYIHGNVIRNNSGWEGKSGIHIENYFTAAEVSGKTLDYVFANNEIYNNYGDGVYLYTEVAGDEESRSVSDLSINNIFVNNDIHDNQGNGVEAYTCVGSRCDWW